MFVLFLAVSLAGAAPEADTLPLLQPGARAIEALPADPVPATTAPGRWTGAETVLALGTVAGTVALMPFDPTLGDLLPEDPGPGLRGASAAAKLLGDGYVTIPVAGILWGIGEWGNAPRLARASRNGLLAWAWTQVGVQSLKHGLRRARPSESGSSTDWHGPGLGSRFLSFPSGHSASAWGLLPAYALEYRGIWWVPVLAYGLSASVSLSRLQDRQHWASDVFFSAGLGLLCNRLVWNGGRGATAAVRVLPVWEKGRQGVSIVSAF